MGVKKLPVVPQVEKQDEIKVVESIPDATDPKPKEIVTTKRSSPIVRTMPLTESHGMTTESNRFKES